MEIFLAYICLKVFETGSLCCCISSFYSIFLFKSLLKSITLRKKRGGRFLEGGAFQKKYGNTTTTKSRMTFSSQSHPRVSGRLWTKIEFLHSSLFFLFIHQRTFLFNKVNDFFPCMKKDKPRKKTPAFVSSLAARLFLWLFGWLIQ